MDSSGGAKEQSSSPPWASATNPSPRCCDHIVHARSFSTMGRGGLANRVSIFNHHIRGGLDILPAQFGVACREATECHIDDALVCVVADISGTAQDKQLLREPRTLLACCRDRSFSRRSSAAAGCAGRHSVGVGTQPARAALPAQQSCNQPRQRC
jgi:hypothetical protein